MSVHAEGHREARYIQIIGSATKYKHVDVCLNSIIGVET